MYEKKKLVNTKKYAKNEILLKLILVIVREK